MLPTFPDVIHHSTWRLHLDSWQRGWKDQLQRKNQPYSMKLKLVICFSKWSKRWLSTSPRAREDPCQTLAKSLTDAGRGVFDMKGLVWYGGELTAERGVNSARSWIGNGLALFIKIVSPNTGPVNLCWKINTSLLLTYMWKYVYTPLNIDFGTES